MRPALLAFALDAMAIAAVAILGLAHVLPPEAVIGFFCTVWAAGRGGPPQPPPRPELGGANPRELLKVIHGGRAPVPLAARSTLRVAVRSTLIARAALSIERSARDLARMTLSYLGTPA